MKLDLEKVTSTANILDLLTDEEKSETVHKIATLCLNGYEEDNSSRAQWKSNCEQIIDIAKLEHTRTNRPWDGATNVKIPVVMTAVMQFAARTSGGLINDGRIVKSKVIGQDPDGQKFLKSERVSKFMSWQLLDRDDSIWEDSNDKMLVVLGLIGTVFKKTYFDPMTNQNISKYVHWEDVVVHNDTTSLSEARRISHTYSMSRSDLLSMVNLGWFCDPLSDRPEAERREFQSKINHEILEQHTFLDLDDDGIEEPYIVYIDKGTSKVIRIVARFSTSDVRATQDGAIYAIKPLDYFTDFHFIPSPEGKFYSYGYGTLLLSHNKAVNAIYNQLINSGELHSINAFVASEGSIRGEKSSFSLSPGKVSFLRVPSGKDISSVLRELPTHEPSTVLAGVAQFLISSAEKLTSVSDVVTGSTDAQYTKPSTVQALLQQAQVTFTAIQKRIYRSYRREFSKLFDLNRFYLPDFFVRDYLIVLDDPQADPIKDFDTTSYDIIPVIDPTEAESSKKQIRVGELMQLLNLPGLNKQEIIRQLVQEMTVYNKDAILAGDQTQPPPDPKMVQIESDMKIKAEKLIQEQQQFDKDYALREIDVKSKALAAIATAESLKTGSNINQYKAEMDALVSAINVTHDRMKLNKDAATANSTPTEGA